jgi:hypothetical protein
MFCNIRHYHVDESQMDELMHRIDAEFVDLVEREPGFVGYHACDCGDGTLITLTMFHDGDAAMKSATTAAAFVRDRLGDFEIERLNAWNGDIKVNRAIAEMLEPAHA